MDDITQRGFSHVMPDVGALFRVRPGLSAKLLVLTIAFVMLAEVLIFIPSVANFRRTWLMNKVSAAATAALVFDAAPSGMVAPELGQELLKQVGALTIWSRRVDSRMLVASIERPPEVDVTTDLRELNPLREIAESMMTLAARPGRILRITARGMGGVVINMTIEENRLREAMWGFARNILILSLIISLITAGLVYVSLLYMIVRPIRRLSENMAGFENEPENSARIIPTGTRSDEIGFAERSLARLEAKLADELRRSKKLAALGLMIAKISHDRRRMLGARHARDGATAVSAEGAGARQRGPTRHRDHGGSRPDGARLPQPDAQLAAGDGGGPGPPACVGGCGRARRGGSHHREGARGRR